MQIVQARGREIPVVTRHKRYTPERARAEALFNKPATVAKPRILEDAPKMTASVALPVKVAAVKPASPNETEHEKVFRLVREGLFEEAARLAARLINSGNDEDFFIHAGTAAYRNAEEWFENRVQSGISSPTSGFEIITPEKAQVLLLSNSGNRKVRASNIALVMRDIASGRWEKNGETLIVSVDGRLNDGQHRNFAILLTQTAIETAMAFGLTRESIATVDIGVKRTGGDRLGFLEIKNYSRIAAIISIAYKILAGRSATESEKVYFYRDNADHLQKCANLANNLPRGAQGANFGAAALILLRQGAPEDSLSDFFAEIRGSLLPKSKNSPALKLRELLLARSFKAPADKQIYTIVDLYVRWASGKKVMSISIANELRFTVK